MKILKIFLDIEKEERWLNEMSEKGYALISKSLRYKFDKTEIIDRTVRVDFRTFKSKSDYVDYKILFEDSGWKYVAGSKNSGNHYFEKILNGEVDDIFSDEFSRVAKLKRYTTYWAFYSLIILIATSGVRDMTMNPKELFLTPGLWDMVGTEFWRAFWIEVPAVFLRAFYSVGFILLVFGYIYVTYASAKKVLKNRVTQV